MREEEREKKCISGNIGQIIQGRPQRKEKPFTPPSSFFAFSFSCCNCSCRNKGAYNLREGRSFYRAVSCTEYATMNESLTILVLYSFFMLKNGWIDIQSGTICTTEMGLEQVLKCMPDCMVLIIKLFLVQKWAQMHAWLHGSDHIRDA